MPVKVRQRAVRIGRLTTVMEVAAEIGKVYRDCRHEKIDAAFGNRLASILSAMRACLEVAEFERRIAQIEAAVQARVATNSRSVFDAFDSSAPTEDDGTSPEKRRH